MNKIIPQINPLWLKMKEKMQNEKKIRLVLVMFALSNMAALIYQISWTKNLSYVFGTSVYAIGTVLACFMSGLAVGSFVFGRRADRSTNPVRLFAYVELALGLYALILIPLFTLLPQPYSFFHRIFGGTPFMNLMLFALSFQVLIIPTSLIGGTFPIMNRLYSRIGTIGKDVGTVYSVDTVFAGAGALIAGFVLLPVLGISMTIAVGAALNILAGIYLYNISVHPTEYSLDRGKKSDIKTIINGLNNADKTVFMAYFLSGFAGLSAEVIWIRALSLTLGTSMYAISIITAGFLIGLALGSFFMSKYIHRIKNLLTAFAFIELGIAASAVLLLLVIKNLDIPYLVLYHTFDSFYPFTAALFIIIFLILLVPTTLMGATMPVVSKIITKNPMFIGTDTGAVFTINTLGAIFGTFIASFILIPGAGMTMSGAFIAALNIITALLIFARSGRENKKKFYSLTAVTLLLSIYLASTTISPVSAGAYYHGTQLKDIGSWDKMKSETEVLHYEEGLYGLVSAVRQGEYTALRIDGKSESSNVPVELVTEYQLAYIPMFAHSSPKEVMLIGLGGGFTLDAVTNFKEVDSIDLVEINPHLLNVAREYFSEYNGMALSDPRVNTIIDDGRNHLLASDKKYDVIISQPSNIWLSGEGGLFTKEMYEGVKAHLNTGGVFGQWLPLYEQDAEDFRIFLATFRSVFPYATLWIVDYDAVLVGSTEPNEYDYGYIQQHIASNPEINQDFKMMSDVLLTTTKYAQLYQVVVPYRMNGDDIKEFSGSVINTDDRPVLEFSAAKNTVYQGSVEKPFKEVSGFLQDKYGLVLSLPFTNLTSMDREIKLDFIDLKTGLDSSWKEQTSDIYVDHSKNVVFMESVFTKGNSQFLVVALPLSDQPLTDDFKERVISGMNKNGYIEAGELPVNGHWGYEMKKADGDYVVSWFCEHNDILYTLEISGVMQLQKKEIIDNLSCVH